MIGILGAGAFGTALAVALARNGKPVTLWARNTDHVTEMIRVGEHRHRLPGIRLPELLKPTDAATDLAASETVLLAVPSQSLSDILAQFRDFLSGRHLIACCKGIDLDSGFGPASRIDRAVPSATPALLSGPGFAAEIAGGSPTALVLAATDEDRVSMLQRTLSTANLRIYTSTDMRGVEIGGALKNVVAIACGMAIGAGLGESARAAVMTRGFAEMVRFAHSRGARSETLAGLSGLGDLVLTATSKKSRNYTFGLDLGAHGRITPTVTTEGIATARAIARIAKAENLGLPIMTMVSELLDGNLNIAQATGSLMARPLRPE